jgi:hypothetical protein
VIGASGPLMSPQLRQRLAGSVEAVSIRRADRAWDAPLRDPRLNDPGSDRNEDICVHRSACEGRLEAWRIGSHQASRTTDSPELASRLVAWHPERARPGRGASGFVLCTPVRTMNHEPPIPSSPEFGR